MSGVEHVEAKVIRHEHRGGEYAVAIVRAGRVETERVVPPAGERHAFDLRTWPVEVQVSVSPTGRSVQVFVNGKRVAT